MAIQVDLQNGLDLVLLARHAHTCYLGRNLGHICDVGQRLGHGLPCKIKQEITVNYYLNTRPTMCFILRHHIPMDTS